MTLEGPLNLGFDTNAGEDHAYRFGFHQRPAIEGGLVYGMTRDGISDDLGLNSVR